MPRTAITKITAPGAYAGAATACTWTAADTGNQNYFLATGKELILIRNVHAASTYTYTLTSVDDPMGRSETIGPTNLVAQAMVVIGPMQITGWAQTTGWFHLEGNNANIEFLILVLP